MPTGTPLIIKIMREYTGQIADITNDAPVVLHIQTADRFKKN